MSGISLRVTVALNVALWGMRAYDASQWTSQSSPFKAALALALIADCGHPGMWAILRRNGGKRTRCDATNLIADCWSSRQGLSGCTSDQTLFSLHCFPFRLDQKTIFFVLQLLHLAESMCHRARMKLSFTIEERKPNWCWHTCLYGPCVNKPRLQMNRDILQLCVCML